MKRNHLFKRTAGLALALAVLLVSSMCFGALAEGKTFTFIINGDAGNVFNGFDYIGIHGISSGAAYALLCASLIPDISLVLSIEGGIL